VVACGRYGYDPAGSGSDEDGSVHDSGTVIDSAVIDGALVDSALPIFNHLIITEIKNQGADEFIEIYNLTGLTVDLTDYYLSDSSEYAILSGSAITLDVGDFIAKFPDAATLSHGQVIVVALNGNGFESTTGAPADYELEGDTSAQDMPLIMNSTPNLQSSGEILVLFRWNRLDDLVTDVDIVLTGNNPATADVFRAPMGKTGLMVDGPDVDLVPSTYADDSVGMLAATFSSSPTMPESYKRIALENMGSEVQAGAGNGIDGHDETSEEINVTWDDANYSLSTPGTVPVSLQ